MTFKDALIRNSLDLMAAEHHDCLLKKPVQSEKSQVAESKQKIHVDTTSQPGAYSSPMKRPKQTSLALTLRFPDYETRETVRKAAEADSRTLNSYIILTIARQAQEDLKKLAESVA